MKRVEQAGWPLVFAFLDDRLWQLLGEHSLKAVLNPLLGGAAQQLPGIWVHHVEMGGCGWEPHVDVSGAPTDVKEGVDRITMWLPLTPVSHDNGCIFAVPGSHRLELMQRFDSTDVVSLDEVIRLFHKAEAMEAEPGDALLWRFQTLHWGGPSLPTAKNARTSLSIELGHSEVPAHQDVQPTWPLGAMPSFETRLFLIGRSLVMYGQAKDREPYASRFIDVGRALVELFSS
ncbi:MAG: phytanoyl-CoA dioxygenase family protein [Deltaproteobacteria bacterium]|nr:phytanoyl-CoA dioxygenase family protein [Deltaproteobacteria bacterium]